MKSIIGKDVKTRLDNFFKKLGNVELVFIHGSFAKGQARKDSDIDVAILFKREPDVGQYVNVYLELTSLLKREIDISVLNNASPVFRMQVLKYGIPVFQRERKLYVDFFADTVKRYEDVRIMREKVKKYIAKGRVYVR